jgi:hypothetical protein
MLKTDTKVDERDANQDAREITNVLGEANNDLMQRQNQEDSEGLKVLNQSTKILLAVSFKFDNMPCIRAFILAVTLCLLVPTSQ